MPMPTWSQNYDPLHAWPLSTLVSALPVLTLLTFLVVWRTRVWVAALSGMLVAVVLALIVFRMPPVMVAAACALGGVFGICRIAWVVIASLFLYQIAVETGQFEAMKESIAALSADKRLQVVLIAFCFGAFLEGTGGGGAPVAITGSFLIGLGFEPFHAATLCLLANTAPVAWGAVGTPIRVLSTVTSLPEPALGAMTGRILPPLAAILPLWLVRSMVGWRETCAVWPALVVSGGSFAAIQFYWSNFQDQGLVDIVAALVSLVVTAAFLKLWKPRTILNVRGPDANAVGATAPRHSAATVTKAWSPFLLASVFIFLWSKPAVTGYLTLPVLKQPMPALHLAVVRMPPVVPEPTPEEAVADLNVATTAGTAVALAALVSGLLLGLSPAAIGRTFVRTCIQLAPSAMAIVFMVGLAFLTRYAGMDTILGLSMTRTGVAFPFFGTLLGWLGVALTGTDAGSNALFGNLQRVTADRLGLPPVLMAAANSSGGVMGKMIDAQSIVIASTATHQEGQESDIFRAVLCQSLALVSVVGLIVVLYAFVFPGVVPPESWPKLR
jgi:lactate permease